MSLQVSFTKKLGSTELEVDIELPVEGISAIFGRSGAGKTSLINVISGLITPEKGEIRTQQRTLFSSSQGINLAIEKRKLGYVFQEARLFPHYSVQGNLLYGVKKEDKTYFDTIVDLLALAPLLSRYPNALSGGEKQRVAIGRALLSKPDLLLMDEPLASLDLPRKQEVLPFLEQLAQQVRIPILYVTHSLDEIVRLASYLVVMEEGKIATAGKIEQVWNAPSLLPWLGTQARSSLFIGRVCQHNEEYGMSVVELAPQVPVYIARVQADIGDQLRLQVLAEDVSITLDKQEKTSIRNRLQARIIDTYPVPHAPKHSLWVKLVLAQGCELWATITTWAWQELELSLEQDVYVQIKSISLAHPESISLTPFARRNQ